MMKDRKERLTSSCRRIKFSAELAFNLSKQHQIPLHPDYTYFYHDVTRKDLNSLRTWLTEEINDINIETDLKLDMGPVKRILEVLGVPHRVGDGKIILEHDEAYTLFHTLNEPLDIEGDISTLEALNQVSKVEIMAKAPTYLGGRVGRPEKTKERMMKPAPHALFPIGTFGGSRRNIIDAAKKGSITVDIARCKCTNPNVVWDLCRLSVQCAVPVLCPVAQGKKGSTWPTSLERPMRIQECGNLMR